MSRCSICVLGAGSWGTALAIVLSRAGREVRLVARDDARAAHMQAEHENATYLPGLKFPELLEVTTGLETALADAAAVIIALPCVAVEAHVRRLSLHYREPLIAACKGLHPDTLERTDEMLTRVTDMHRVAVLSGPSFASEVARGLPTALTLAAQDMALAEQASQLFEGTTLRVYTCTDVIGVSLGGALKNVIAIAAGITVGLGLGHNAVAALITRGMPEMVRLASACGAMAETIHGLSGLGDLVLTCTGDLSRNRRFGMALAQGMDAVKAQRHVGQVVEGVRTSAAVRRLAASHGVDIPIMCAVDEVISGRLLPMDAVRALLARPARPEF